MTDKMNQIIRQQKVHKVLCPPPPPTPHTRTYTLIHTHIHSYTHAHTFIYTRTYTHIHTHIHTWHILNFHPSCSLQCTFFCINLNFWLKPMISTKTFNIVFFGLGGGGGIRTPPPPPPLRDTMKMLECICQVKE